APAICVFPGAVGVHGPGDAGRHYAILKHFQPRPKNGPGAAGRARATSAIWGRYVPEPLVPATGIHEAPPLVQATCGERWKPETPAKFSANHTKRKGEPGCE